MKPNPKIKELAEQVGYLPDNHAMLSLSLKT